MNMAAFNPKTPSIDISNLPDISKSEFDFHDSSFFEHDASRQLPTPASVLDRHPENGSGVAIFEDLGLAVKYGSSTYLRLEEAQTMYALRKAFPNAEVPVPEVFGWRTHGHLNFIYMSLIEGPTLQQAWSSLTKVDKEAISAQLAGIIAHLQSITGYALIASVNGGTVQDRFFKLDYELGPFSSIREFNDCLFAAATRSEFPLRETSVERLYRDLLPDEGNIFFTHGDLTLTNIIVSAVPGSPAKIVGIIDWEQAGWYPEYWEYCKLLYAVHYDHEWRAAGWVDTLMKPFENEWIAFAEYSLWRCP